MDRFSQAEPAGQSPVGDRIAAAANQQWIGRAARFWRRRCAERLEQRLQTLEREVVAGEQPDQVAGLEPEPVAKRAAQGAGLRDLQPRGIDRVGHDVDPVERNAVILLPDAVSPCR